MQHLKLLLRQFPFFLGVRIFLVDSVRKLFDPFRRTSYSQTGEDRIIDFYLGTKASKRPFYVDIGCNKPFALSNTMLLYQRGANGLAIDANPALVDAYKKARPRDTCICACLSNRVGNGVLTIAKLDAMSTISERFADEFLDENAIENKIPVEFVTAQHVFEQHNVPHDFELLSIDVEGHDFEVLTSFDLKIYRPKLIVVEMHDARGDLDAMKALDVYQYLSANGYRLCAFATMNGFFLRESD